MVMIHVKNVLRKYAVFSGKASRAEFWNFFGFFWSTMLIVAMIETLIGVDFIFPLVYLGLLLPYISCAVRRVRDSGGNGWFILIPIYNIILLFSPSKDNSSVD